MNKKFYLFCITSLIGVSFFAQQKDAILIRIAGKPVSKSEIVDAYSKDHNWGIKKINKDSLNQFIGGYIDYKLNVAEAKAQLLDTTASYRREYEAYKLQLAGGYMTDTIGTEALIRKLYGRIVEEVEINHVLLPFDKPTVLPADTLSLYHKAMERRKELLSQGFTDQGKAREVSTGLLMNIELHNGYLGWIRGFMLSLPVEDAVFTLPLGEVSMPIRSLKGYHIIQVLNKRPAKGNVDVEQVLFNFPNIPASQAQIDSVRDVVNRQYAYIKKTGDFQSICDDFTKVYGMGEQGCKYGLVGRETQLPQSFIAAAMDLQNPGDVSEPVQTDYGFHIIRLIERIPIAPYASVKNIFTKKVMQGDRSWLFIAERKKRLAAQFNLSVNEHAYDILKSAANNLSPYDTTFISQIANRDEILFTIDSKEQYKVSDFLTYLQSKIEDANESQEQMSVSQTVDITFYNLSTDNLKHVFDSYVYRKLQEYNKATLEDRYPEFRKQMEAFSDGILLFAVKNRNIWEKSKIDDVGLTACFEKNRAKYTLPGKRFKGVVVYVKDEQTLRDVEALAAKEADRIKFVNLLKETFNRDDIKVQIEPGLWAQGNNAYVDNKIFGGQVPSAKKGYPFFFVTGKFIDQPEDYTDVRNAVESDYLEELESKWTPYLRNKYSVSIDNNVLKTIK